MAEALRTLIAKCLETEGNSIAIDFLNSRQLVAGVKGGTEDIILLTKLSYEKITASSSSSALNIGFRYDFTSIKSSEMLIEVAILFAGVASFTSFGYSQRSHSFMARFKLAWKT